MVVLPTAYAPSVAYMSYLLDSSTRIEAHEYYQKQTYRNRCAIVGAEGVMKLCWRMLTAPATHLHRQHSDRRGHRLRPVLPSLRWVARLRRQSQHPRFALQYGTRVTPHLATATQQTLGSLATLEHLDEGSPLKLAQV